MPMTLLKMGGVQALKNAEGGDAVVHGVKVCLIYRGGVGA